VAVRNEVTHAADWFESELELRQLCGDAQSQAYTTRAQDFARDMVISAKSKGLEMFMSVEQLKFLCRLADWHVPMRLVNGRRQVET
jgi:hypothetical protein